ncbi:MAG: hypothetical protein ACRD47_02505, partial [Nitrososphaeraceae archaeon]
IRRIEFVNLGKIRDPSADMRIDLSGTVNVPEILKEVLLSSHPALFIFEPQTEHIISLCSLPHPMQ